MKKVYSAVITLIALTSFIFLADKLVWDFKTWECVCTHDVCEWCVSESDEWDMYHAEAFQEYALEFDAIFDMIEFKVAKNGRSMVKGAYSTSFKFVQGRK